MKFEEEDIIDYIEGKLDATQEQLIEQELKDNLALRDIYQAQKLVHEALDYHHDQTLKKSFHQWSSELIETNKVNQTFLFSRRNWFAIAASFIILSGAIFLISRPSHEDRLLDHGSGDKIRLQQQGTIHPIIQQGLLLDPSAVP